MLRALRRQIDAIKEAQRDVEFARDTLRDAYSDAEDILEDLDMGETEIANGLRLIEDGIDTYSRHI